MTIRDMHIEVNQSLQKVAANRTRKFEPEEIDLILNKMIARFIQTKIKPVTNNLGGFSVDIMELEALRPLLVTNYEVPAFQENSDFYRAPLPTNYAYLIADSSGVINLCGTSPVLNEVNYVYTILKLQRSGKEVAPFYKTMELTFGTTTVSLPANYPGLLNREDVDSLVSYFITEFANRGIELYWERCESIDAPDSFITRTLLPWSAVTLVIDGSDLGVPTEITEPRVVASSTASPAVFTANRLSSSAVIPNLLTTSFFMPTYHAPISELSGNFLQVYARNNFIVTKCRLNYVRKTRLVSLSLNSDCELPETYHQTICDLAVEYIKGRLQNKDGMETVISDNERRVLL